jgi:hypothetical protein
MNSRDYVKYLIDIFRRHMAREKSNVLPRIELYESRQYVEDRIREVEERFSEK